MFILENLDNYQLIIVFFMMEVNTIGKVGEFYFFFLGDRYLLNLEINLCEVYRDQLYDIQECLKLLEQIYELNLEIVRIKAVNVNSYI